MIDFSKNRRYGSKRVNLDGNRYTMPIAQGKARFPLGIDGLLPVMTLHRGGRKEVTYAFCDETDAPALASAVDVADAMVDDAVKLAHHNFAPMRDACVTVPTSGWRFSRVEYVPVDKRGNPAPTPVRLWLETEADDAGVYYSGSIDYDADGEVDRVSVSEVVTPTLAFLVIATRAGGRLAVHKVEQIYGRDNHRKPLYKER